MIEPAKILVIGDVMLDRTTRGAASRISPEAPVPVLSQTTLQEVPGGAANVAMNIKSLGHVPLLMGVIGDDEAGQRLSTVLAEYGIGTCLPKGRKPTIVKHRVIADGQLLVRTDQEDSPFDGVETELLRGLGNLPDDLRLIVISDYAKGTMTPAVVQRLREISTAVSPPIPIFVDAKPSTMDLYHGVSLLAPNLQEGLQMLESMCHPALFGTTDVYDQAPAVCSLLRSHYRCGGVVLTMGRHGCCYTDPVDEYRPHFFDAIGGDLIADLCGAGDTTLAALAAAAVERKDFSQAVLFSMAAAGLAVTIPGTTAVDRDAVDEFQLQHFPRKVMDWESMLDRVYRKRRIDPQVRVVLTNGCFDGLHAGHLETLRFAKKQGEFLVVAYNDDESLRSLKGEDRPHVPDSFRASHLALQECVDVVVRFNGDVNKLVRAVKPDVLVKGDDTGATIPGADYVASKGGRVERCPIGEFYVTVDRKHPFRPFTTS